MPKNQGVRGVESKPLLKALGYIWLPLKIFLLTVWGFYQLALGAVLVALVWGFFQLTDITHYWEIRRLRTQNPETTAFMKLEKQRLTEIAQGDSKAELPDSAATLRQGWVPFDSIPKTVRELVVVAEDAKFYDHDGFDFREIEYAIVANHQAGKKARGASTISQQLAKNLFLEPDKTLRRKVHEAALTLLMEYELSKERILELYLNVAQFGPGVFGVSEGARHHFDKTLDELTLSESIALVAVLPSPVKWHPGSGRGVYQSHKSRVTRNYALYKGLRDKVDFASEDWEVQVFGQLSDELSDKKWDRLRSAPAENAEEGEEENNGSPVPDSTLQPNSAEPIPDFEGDAEVMPEGEGSTVPETAY